MDYFGYAGKILHINLTNGDIKSNELDLDITQKFIGGQGLSTYLLSQLLKPNTDPYDPDNPMIIGVGTLVGTITPGSSKVAATYKSPVISSMVENKYLVTSSIGGTKRFGIMLKSAGYDHVVITGKADKPCYIKIVDDDVEICDARDLWGKKDLYETSDELVKRHGGASGICGVWAIGKSGENLVRWAHAFVDKRGTLGRVGGGAVLGSKNIKAVVALGTKGVKIADPKRFMAAVQKMRKYIIEHPLFNKPYPYKGSYDMFAQYSEDLFDKTRITRSGCISCLGGEFWNHVIKGGERPGCGIQGGIFVFNREFGQRLGIEKAEDMLWFNDLISRNGMCVPTTCNMINWVTRLYERGIISKADTGGLELKHGDIYTYVALFNKILNKEDIGALMAEGWYPLGKAVGVDPSMDFEHGRSISKGVDLIMDARMFGVTPAIFGPVVRARIIHTHQATHDPRVEDVYKETNWPAVPKSFNDVKRNFVAMGTKEEEMERVFTDKYFHTGRLEKHAEDASAVYNSLGICDISTYGLSAPLQDIPWLAEVYSSATGFETTAEELKLRGECICNLEKLLNVREGFTREDDKYPGVWEQNIHRPFSMTDKQTKMKHLLTDNYLHDWFGRPLNDQGIIDILNEYYDERGWDIKQGIPTIETLRRLGLESILEK